MAQKFKLKELQKLYGSRSKIIKGNENKRNEDEKDEDEEKKMNNLTEELIEGKTILERLQKLSYIKGLRLKY